MFPASFLQDAEDPEGESRPDRDTFRHIPGVYQIGLVYARSWWLSGTSAGISMPKNFESYACQVGVGISSTRA